jgi:hypothetical protein
MAPPAERGGEGEVHHEGGLYKVIARRTPKPLHRALKSHCVIVGTSVMEFVTKAIEETLARSSDAPAKRQR